MKRPKPTGTAVDARRFDAWLANFQSYSSPVTRGSIEVWLSKFAEPEKDTAARILDSVLFYSHAHIQALFRDLLSGLDGWHRLKSKRAGRWFFVPFSSSSGESGDSMTHAFRMANGMATRYFDELFIHRSEIVGKGLGPEDTVVLIDDFSGSGNQACTSWNEVFSELLASGPRVYLMIVAATVDAAKRIKNETDMELVCKNLLRPSSNFFSEKCGYFTAAEKSIILEHCVKADPAHPRGYGDCGLLFVLSHQTPNNSLPILTAADGLFPRA